MVRPSAKDFLTNLRKKMPWGEKLGLIMRNNLIKIKTGKNCCGHPGEPGC